MLGLAFKADIDDLRESPALQIAAEVAQTVPGARLLAVEPHIEQLPPGLASFDSVRLTSAEEALAVADIVVLLVDHRQFRSIDPATLAEKVVVDTRGLWSQAQSLAGAPRGLADARQLVAAT